MVDQVPGVDPDTELETVREPVPDVVGRGSSVTRRVAVTTGLVAVAGLATACAVGGSDPADAGTSAGAGGSESTGDPVDGIVALAEVPVGAAVAVTIDGAPAVVARPADATVAAFSARCTHMGCTVAVAGATLRCPCHGSRFDALTGAVLGGPATVDLPAIAVHLDGDDVVAG